MYFTNFQSKSLEGSRFHKEASTVFVRNSFWFNSYFEKRPFGITPEKNKPQKRYPPLRLKRIEWGKLSFTPEINSNTTYCIFLLYAVTLPATAAANSRGVLTTICGSQAKIVGNISSCLPIKHSSSNSPPAVFRKIFCLGK